MIQIGELLNGVDVISAGDLTGSVEGLSYFAGKIKPNWVYTACDLPWLPGYSLLNEAVDRGAGIVVIDRSVSVPLPSKLRTIMVRDSKKAYSTMCANFFRNAHKHLSIYAVTGTKGKTSTCHILDSIFKCAGLRTGLISTIVRKIDDRQASSSCTTPDPYELHGLLYLMRCLGITHVVLEVSSIGIAEERILGLRPEGMIYTNLGHEHLTYHGGLENYKAAKARLFTEYASSGGKPSVCAINVDDPFGSHLASVAKGEVVTYGMRGEVCGRDLVLDAGGIRGVVSGIPIRSLLLGEHNAYNILAAVALSRNIGIPPESIAKGISDLRSIPGRLERVENEQGKEIFVDYAHTPESVQAVLSAMRRAFADKRLVTVLGCGGGSDRSKRPLMAQRAIENSDLCIFTSDNPRQENPVSIIEDMLNGIQAEQLTRQGKLEIIIDRQEAIQRGVEAVDEAGVLVLLGKGHERTQIIGSSAVRFDDREVAVDALRF
jgi:UDP-N-acetylmuramyl-tripeptide synthetase